MLVASFIDPRHARVYGGQGIFRNVLDRISARNAWPRETGYRGYATVGIEELAIEKHIHFVLIAPVPPDLRASLRRSPLWLELLLVKAGRVSTLPPVFMFVCGGFGTNVAAAPLSLLTARWLDILPLGGAQAKSLGIPLARACFALLMLAVTAAGAIIMACADTLGRTAAFPPQMPSGLTAAFVGASFLMLPLSRRSAAA